VTSVDFEEVDGVDAVDGVDRVTRSDLVRRPMAAAICSSSRRITPLLEQVVYLLGGGFKRGGSLRSIQINSVKGRPHDSVNIAGVIGDRK